MNKKQLIINKEKLKCNSKTYIKSRIENIKGITLISLIITIIVLLILSGIAINLSLGQNGIYSRAKQAKEEYEKAQAKEKLEQILIEAKLEKETNGNYNSEYLDNILQKKGIKVNGNYVMIDNYNFSIDKEKLQIITNLDSEQICIIEIPYIGTTSFKVKISNIYNEENVKEYIYIIDGNEEKTTTEKEYIKKDLLPETNHIANIVVKYKNGKTIESNTINLKLEPRTYLLKEGDECTDITGGWKGIAIVDDDGIDIEPVIPEIALNKEEGYINLYLKATEVKWIAGGLTINNSIDYTKYKNFCVEFTGTLGRYNSGTIVATYINSSKLEWLGTLVYSTAEREKKILSMEIQDTNIEDIFFYIQSNKNDGEANCNIYNVWLEK